MRKEDAYTLALVQGRASPGKSWVSIRLRRERKQSTWRTMNFWWRKSFRNCDKVGERIWTGDVQGLMEIRVREMKGDLELLAGTDVNRRKVHNAIRLGRLKAISNGKAVSPGLPWLWLIEARRSREAWVLLWAHGPPSNTQQGRVAPHVCGRWDTTQI